MTEGEHGREGKLMAKKKTLPDAPAGYHVTLTYLDNFGVYKAEVIHDGEPLWETKTQADPTIVIAQAWTRLHELARENALAQKRSDKALRTIQDTLEAHDL